jgi:hypothetical protein
MELVAVIEAVTLETVEQADLLLQQDIQALTVEMVQPVPTVSSLSVI